MSASGRPMAAGIIDLVGNTPMLELARIGREIPGRTLLAKAEFLNPSGSVKDRAARAMLLEGLRTGRLTRDRIVIDATSGNTGIAYALMGAALGLAVTLCMPGNASRERKEMIMAYGASIIETDPLEGSDGAYLAAKAKVAAAPERYFHPDQYDNPANPQAHYETTGPEILAQTGGAVTHFTTGMGTSGTFMGVTRFLKERIPAVRAISVQPDGPFHGIEGTKHMASTIKPGIYDETAADDTVLVSTEAAYAMVRRLAREEGILVGISSGANVHAALTLAHSLPMGSRIVTILCDSGDRYLTDDFWREAP